MDKEKLIKEIMADLGCTRADAEEVAEMELKSDRHYVSGDKRNRKPRTVKEDSEKLNIQKIIVSALNENGYATEVIKQGEMTADGLTIKIIRHRT